MNLGSVRDFSSDVSRLAHNDYPAKHMEVKKLGISYFGKTALQDVSLNIYRGCITALVGPSGCGKSSFLSSLSRMTDLVPGCKVKGYIAFDGSDIHDERVNVMGLRRRVGMIFQKPNPFPISIKGNILMPLKQHGIRDRGELEDRLQQAMIDVGLWKEVNGRLNDSALSLSGGQQQRLCIARALALTPSVLLMDEPCSALDPISSKIIEELISRLKSKYTVVIVTHNLAQARRISDYSAVFWTQKNSGTIIEFGETKRVFSAPQNKLTADYIFGLQG